MAKPTLEYDALNFAPNLTFTPMQIRILFFGIAREIAGGNTLHIEIAAPAKVADLKELLGKRFPDLAKLRSFAIAVNQQYAGPDVQINAQDEIAIIPPVSGG